MTIDKIKHYMWDDLFNHWGSVTDINVIECAEKQLSYEIETGLINGIQYHAELYLLRHLLSK